uniref:Uncharacterized protein n=1 Tax=Oryza nivara TaxID=4536 RepID=A0A0E0IXB1_ORYNI
MAGPSPLPDPMGGEAVVQRQHGGVLPYARADGRGGLLSTTCEREKDVYCINHACMLSLPAGTAVGRQQVASKLKPTIHYVHVYLPTAREGERSCKAATEQPLPSRCVEAWRGTGRARTPSLSRTWLHRFSFPNLSWGTHRLLRCSKNPASSPPPAAPDTPIVGRGEGHPTASLTAWASAVHLSGVCSGRGTSAPAALPPPRRVRRDRTMRPMHGVLPAHNKPGDDQASN